MSNPSCPICSGAMVTRTSAHGKFYGCRSFPRCKGTARLGAVTASDGGGKRAERGARGQSVAVSRSGATGKSMLGGMVLQRRVPDVQGSEEQAAIWAAICGGSGHAVVQARAGTGKSFTIFHAACRADTALRVGVLAFNRVIAAEMAGRFSAAGVDNCSAVTFHSLGYGAIRRAYGSGVAIDSYKMRNVAEAMLPEGTAGVEADRLDDTRGNLAKLAGLCKGYMADPCDLGLLAELADKHGLELGEGAEQALVLGLVGAALEESWRQREQAVDFDDMLYVPVRGGLRPEQFDLLMVDEAQDVNAVQIQLALMAVKDGGRLVVVADKFQTIYGFRGSHSNSVQAFAEAVGDVTNYPLTVTRRCGRHIVRLAQCLVPDIAALPDAPDGVIRERVGWEQATGEMAAGDMVLCRVNRYLVPVAYALLRRGVKAVIRGRDIGANVTSLVLRVLGGKSSRGTNRLERFAATTIPTLLRALTEHREREETRLLALGKNGAGRLESLMDQCDTLAELCEGLDTVGELRGKLDSLFADFDPTGQPVNAVVCSTVHGAKGLEAERVWVLNTELLPHPRAARDWEREQEHNLIYVAVTRAKRELAFVAGKAGQWKGGDGAAPGCLREGMEAIAAEVAARELVLAAEAEGFVLPYVAETPAQTNPLTEAQKIMPNGEEPPSEEEDERWLRRRELDEEVPF